MSARGNPVRVHGGADAQGAARWDFSTCANAAGPCPAALAAVQAADPTRYPDPAGTAVRQALAALHGVAPARVLLAASASEFIQRITAVSARLAPGPVQVPVHAYGDYAAAAAAWGRKVVHAGTDAVQAATLRWQAEPSSPLGRDDPPPAQPGACATVLDAVYAPLRLAGETSWRRAAQDAVFVLHSPNKALGLTGVRGAYAIAADTPATPAAAGFDVETWCAALERAAPSWPLSAQADAMLRCWVTPEVQQWVAGSLSVLAEWRAQMQLQLTDRGFAIESSVTPFFVARPPASIAPQALHALRRCGVAVRDATSFGLPGAWRLSAQAPAAQAALWQALDQQALQKEPAA
jgi:histidinol-phosphate aminotransferase